MSDDAISALKHFRRDACGRLKYPPSKRKVAVNHAETFTDIVHGCEFLENHLQRNSSCEDDTEGAEHRGCCNQVCTLRSRLLIKLPRTIWRAFATGWLRWAGSPRCLRVDPHRSQIARGLFDIAEGRGIFVEPTPAEAHWQMGTS